MADNRILFQDCHIFRQLLYFYTGLDGRGFEHKIAAKNLAWTLLK